MNYNLRHHYRHHVVGTPISLAHYLLLTSLIILSSHAFTVHRSPSLASSSSSFSSVSIPASLSSSLSSYLPSSFAQTHRRIQQTSTSVSSQAPNKNDAFLNSIEEDSFETFVQMRTGLPSLSLSSSTYNATTYWTGDGALHSQPSGAILARVRGFDVAQGVRIDADTVRQYSRKIFWFLHPDTGEILTEHRGRPVLPIRYDWQVIEYRRGERCCPQIIGMDDHDWDDSGGEGERGAYLITIQPSILKSPRAVPCMPITPRYAGTSRRQVLFHVPLFLDLPLPPPSSNRRYQAWEMYDYCLSRPTPSCNLSDNATDNVQVDLLPPPAFAWTRQGSTPPFITDGTGVMHVTGHRVNTFEELPRKMREWVDKEYPLFREPPWNMDEVDRLIGEEELKREFRRKREKDENSVERENLGEANCSNKATVTTATNGSC